MRFKVFGADLAGQVLVPSGSRHSATDDACHVHQEISLTYSIVVSLGLPLKCTPNDTGEILARITPYFGPAGILCQFDRPAEHYCKRPCVSCSTSIAKTVLVARVL